MKIFIESLYVMAVVMMVSVSAYAQTFTVPVTAMDDVIADITAWGTALITVLLAMIGFKYVRRILR